MQRMDKSCLPTSLKNAIYESYNTKEKKSFKGFEKVSSTFSAEIMASKGAFVPQILRSKEQACFIRFVPALLNAELRVICEQISTLLPPGILVYLDENADNEPVATDYLSALLSVFLGHFAQEFAGKSVSEAALPQWFFSKRQSCGFMLGL